jgi:hypothetical protein
VIGASHHHRTCYLQVQDLRKTRSDQRIKMSKNRLFKLYIAIVLAIAITLTAQEAVATTALQSGTHVGFACERLPSRYSIRPEHTKESDLWILRTQDVSTEADGGLLDLLSGYRTCSR